MPTTSLLGAALLAAVSTSTADPIDLEVLYLGTAGTDRAADFAEFLGEHFATVRTADRDAFDPSTVGDADVVVLDWSQSDVDIMDMGAIASPLGPRDAWTTPTVLLGSAGLLIAGEWQTAGSYG